MRKTTRKFDLEKLEEGVSIAKTSEGRTHRKAILEAIYEQLKDDYLEKLRVALVDALKRNDHAQMNKIRRLVEDYAKSRAFIKSQYNAKKRISEKEAKNWLQREVIKNGGK